jgi:hypothetical protein
MVFLSSRLVSATSGKSFSHSYGLQASIMAREFINAFESGGIIGSRELTSTVDHSAHLEIPVDPFERS